MNQHFLNRKFHDVSCSVFFLVQVAVKYSAQKEASRLLSYMQCNVHLFAQDVYAMLDLDMPLPEAALRPACLACSYRTAVCWFPSTKIATNQGWETLCTYKNSLLLVVLDAYDPKVAGSMMKIIGKGERRPVLGAWGWPSWDVLPSHAR